MLTFAFYKAVPGRFADRVIRFASGSIYSHVEFVMAGPNRDGKSFCISASKRDDGMVRAKRFVMNPEHWDYITVPGDYAAAKARAISQLGTPYNTLSAALSITPWPWRAGGGTHCSWFGGDLAGVPNAHRLTPGELHDILEARERMQGPKGVRRDDKE